MEYQDVVNFHGHSCPGLAFGYRVALLGLKGLGLKRGSDEELVCIVENDSCAVDAIQFVAGCTFGKGNLIFKDYGKQVYTFISRDRGDAIRISVKFDLPETPEEKSLWERFLKGDPSFEVIEYAKERRAKYVLSILKGDERDLFDISYPTLVLPKKARIFKTIVCENCGEKLAEVKARLRDNKVLCIPCFESMD